MLAETNTSLNYHLESKALLVGYKFIHMSHFLSMLTAFVQVVYNFNADRGNESRRNMSSRTLSARVGSIGASEHNKKRGMVLPFTPLSITFDEIRYSVEMPQVQ